MSYLFFVVAFVALQLCKGQYSHIDNKHGWDIRLSVPGEPGQDYPTLSGIPKTSFSCIDKEAGYYADVETHCQVFRVCALDTTYGFQSFLCPNGTIFNQKVAVCDWWMNVKCENSEQYFNDNIEKLNKFRLGPQMMNDINTMLIHTVKNRYDKEKTGADYLTAQKSSQNGIPVRNSKKNPSNIYIPPNQEPPSNYDHINNILISSSTFKPPYLSANFNDFEIKETVPQVSVTQRNNNHLHFLESTNTNRVSTNHAPVKLIDASSTKTFLKQNLYNNFNGQQRKWNDHDMSNRNENKEDQTQHAYKYLTNKQKLSPQRMFSEISNIPYLNRPNKSSRRLSRVTFKTWVFTPNKSAKFILESTPHTPSISKKRSSSTKLISKSPSYSTPDDLLKSQTGYTYNKPPAEMLSRIISTPNKLSHITPSLFHKTPTTAVPSTIPTRSYLPPAIKNSTRHLPFYLPPYFYSDQNNKLPLSTFSSTTPHKENFRATTTSVPVYIPPTYPSYSTTKQAHGNVNLEKFAIIYKEKESHIFPSTTVQNTNNTLTVSNKSKKIHQNTKDFNSFGSLSSDFENGNQEIIENSEYNASPSIELQPPFQTIDGRKNDANEIITLPYYKEDHINPSETFEETMNLKTSPKLYAYLYHNKNKNLFDKLQILNLGMHNYLILTNENVFSNSTDYKFTPLGKFLYEENAKTSLNSKNKYKNFLKENNHFIKEDGKNINSDDLTEITNMISDLTSSQFSEKETLGISKHQQFQTNLIRENLRNRHPEIHSTNTFSPSKNTNEKLKSNIIHNKLYSGELYKYPVPDVNRLILNEQKSRYQDSFKDDLQNTEVSDLHVDLQENVFSKPKKLEEKSNLKLETIDNEFPSNGYPDKLRTAAKTNTVFNYTLVNSYDPVYHDDSPEFAQVQGKVLKSESNTVPNTELEKNNKSLSKSQTLEQHLQNSHSTTDREIEIRLIPSISWRVDKEEDIRELLHLLKHEKEAQSNEQFTDKYESNNVNQIKNLSSEINYTIDHSVINDKDTKYKVPSAAYTGPSSYLVSQSSVGLLEPHRDQLKNPNLTSGYDSHKSARIEDLDDQKGYRKVSPLPAFTF